MKSFCVVQRSRLCVCRQSSLRELSQALQGSGHQTTRRPVLSREVFQMQRYVRRPSRYTMKSLGEPNATGQLSCLSSCLCVSVTLVYCGQTVGWIKMPLGTEIGLDQHDIVLDKDPAPPRNGAQQPPPTFRPMSVVAKRSPISATAELLSHVYSIMSFSPPNRQHLSHDDCPEERLSCSCCVVQDKYAHEPML